MTTRRIHAQGFALLEVLIALAIIASGVTALLLRMQSISNTTVFIEERTVAHWIAENKMQELIANHSLKRDIQKMRSNKDTLEYDGREWFWESRLQEVPMPEILAPEKMFRLDVEVGIEQGKPMASLSGFVRE